jgi:FKBP-type peptidyl-prolyl cis-trans isomerase FklB
MLFPFTHMKNCVLSFIFLAGTVLVSACHGQTTPDSSPGDTNLLNSDKARESYALGMYFGQGWKKSDMDVDLDLLVRGIKESQAGGATLLTQQQMMDALNDLRKTVAMNRQKAQAAEAQKNQTEGAAFLAENKTKPGVVTLPDGLQYKVITEGTGQTPAPTDTVTVNYRGTSVDGTEFDSSAKAGHPAQFPVGAVIHGWTEALEKMTVGSKWELYIPSDLAYGHSGRPPVIGPDETLIFQVELLSAAAPPPPPQRQPLTSDIIRVPSAQEMKNGAKVETIKASDLQKMEQNSTN